MAKALPTHADLVACNHAVAGHDGTLCDVDGELFIKPCVQAEVDFYTSSFADHPDFADFMPGFLGTLTLSDQEGESFEDVGAALIADIKAQNGHLVEGSAGHHTNGFTAAPKPLHHIHPNGANHEGDAKLSVSQHTIPEVVVPKPSRKIATNQAVVLENASHGFVKPNILDVKLGVRLWADDATEAKKIRFNKVTEETTHKELGFRIAGMRVWQGKDAKGADIDEEGYKIYDKNYGRFSVNKHNVYDAFRNFIFDESAGIDDELAKLVAQAFATDVRRIQEVLENQESRMFSASLLFVFEGDGVALRHAMEEASKTPPVHQNGHANDEDSSSDDDDETKIQEPKIYSAKVIDFAHAEWVPGQGPDENSLLGVRNVATILENLGSGKL